MAFDISIEGAGQIKVIVDDIIDSFISKFDADSGKDFTNALNTYVPSSSSVFYEDAGKLRDSATSELVSPGHLRITYDPVDKYGREYASFAYGLDPYNTNFTTQGTYSYWEQNPLDAPYPFESQIDEILNKYLASI